MRVVYVSSLPKGGPVAHLRTLAPAVAATGVDVRVVCVNEEVARSFAAAGIETSVEPLRHKADLAAARRIRKLLAGADLVHTQDRRAGLLVRPLARTVGATAVHTQHGLPPELGVRLRPAGSVTAAPSDRRAALSARAYLGAEAVLSRLGAVVVPSRALAGFLREHGFPAARLHVVPHGIDVGSAPPPELDREGRPTVVGVVANLEYEKGVDVLLSAAALATEPIRLVILGDGACRESLERTADDLGLDARFDGHVDDVGGRLRDFDVFVLPSRAENFPVAALEAMAAGLPVIATRVGGVPELVVDGETGILVDAERETDLAAALDALAADADRREALGAAGARRVAAEFGADRMASRMVGLYESLA